MWEHASLGRAPGQHACLRQVTVLPTAQALGPPSMYVRARTPSARLHSQPQPQRCTSAFSTGGIPLRRLAAAAGPQSRGRAGPLGACAPTCYAADSVACGRMHLNGKLYPNSDTGSSTLRTAEFRQRRQRARRRLVCGSLEAAGDGSLVPLGLDFLTFLATTVLVIPLFKSVKASPVLGCGHGVRYAAPQCEKLRAPNGLRLCSFGHLCRFLFSGVVLGQLGSVPALSLRFKSSTWSCFTVVSS